MRLPNSLLQSLQNVTGFNEDAFIAVHQQPTPLTSIRLNNEKINASQIDFPLGDAIPWETNGYYLPERPKFTLDPLLHAGCYYVQEASSMFIGEAIKQLVDTKQSIKVLDLCAAPGGKSTHIASLLNANSFLISNEIIAARNNILQENITKWGSANVVVTQNDAKDFAKATNYFDLILLDAPCSGSGLFRRDENAIAHWSEANVQLCSERQQRIIADVLTSLKTGGILLYSTCSYSEVENEGIMDWLSTSMELENKSLELDDEWNITTTTTAHQNVGYRFWPHKVKGEGFFLACFQKVNDNGNARNPKRIKPISQLPIAEQTLLNGYLKTTENLCFIQHQNNILALPNMVYEELAFLQSFLYLKQAGITIGSIAKKAFVPNHPLAMSSLLGNAFTTVAVDKQSALLYLRKQDFAITAPQGWCIINYQNIALGFLKHLGNRSNNYYPKNWRILMQ